MVVCTVEVVRQRGIRYPTAEVPPPAPRRSGCANPWRFAGEYRDTATGDYKIGIRYYQPGVRGWTQTDPVSNYANPPELNRYTYAARGPPLDRTTLGRGALPFWRSRLACAPRISNEPRNLKGDRHVVLARAHDVHRGGAVRCGVSHRRRLRRHR